MRRLVFCLFVTFAAAVSLPGPSVAQNALPAVEYDVEKLPAPVRDMRQKIIEATRSGDIQRLRPLVKPGAPYVGSQPGDDTVDFLKTLSGDAEGREILAIILEVFEAGYVHVDAGTPDEMYVWPYFARLPLDKLSGPQMVELFKLITAGDFDEMKEDGVYDFFRAGIKPDGTWDHLIAGH
jgi:hypothetical protein